MRLRSNIFIQLVGNGTNTLAYFLLTPFLVASVGLERYGILLIILGLVIYVSIAELGLGIATSREIAASDPSRSGDIFGHSLLIGMGLGCVGGALFCLLTFPTIARFLVEEPEIISELSKARWSLFALGMSAVLSGIPIGALYGLSKFVSMNVMNLVTTILVTTSPALYAATIGIDISGLIGSIAMARLLALMIGIGLCILFGLKPKSSVQPPLLRTLLSYGGWATASSMLHRVTNSIDRILVSGMVGAATVAYFVVPQSVLSRTQIFGSALMSSAFPKLAKDPENGGLVQECFRGLFLLSPMFVVGIFLLRPALAVWMGTDFALKSYKIAALVSVWAWLELMGQVPYVVLQAKAILQKEAAISSAIVVPNLILLVVAIWMYGAIGAAIISIIRSCAYLILRLKAGLGIEAPFFEIFAHSAVISVASICIVFIPNLNGSTSIIAFLLCFSGAIILNVYYPSAIAIEVFGALRKAFRHIRNRTKQH